MQATEDLSPPSEDNRRKPFTMHETLENPPGGIARRTVLKATAWSAPVVAMAVATPFAAASTNADLFVRDRGLSDFSEAFNADKSQLLTFGTPLGVTIGQSYNLTPVPVGSLLTFTYDNRVFDGLSIAIAGSPVAVSSPVASGNVSTVTAVVPVELPESGGIDVDTTFATWNKDYLDGIAPFTATIAPPAGIVDPSNGDNTVTVSPTYLPTFDADTSSTVNTYQFTYPNSTEPFPWYTIATFTLRAKGAGDIPADSTFMVFTPEPVVSLTATSITLDGAPAADLLSAPTIDEYNRYTYTLTRPIASGSALHVVFDYVLSTTTPNYQPSSASVSVMPSRMGDRDPVNNATGINRPGDPA